MGTFDHLQSGQARLARGAAAAESAGRRKAWLLAHLSDAELLEAAIALDVATASAEERQVKAWMVSELEERHPSVAGVIETWLAEDTPEPGSYLDAIAEHLGLAGARP